MNDNATIHVMCRYYVLILITWPPDEYTLLFCSIIEKIVVGGLHLLLDDVQKIINKRDRAYFLFKKFFHNGFSAEAVVYNFVLSKF